MSNPDNIRIATGHIDAYDLANTAAYKVIDWTRTSDMTASDSWQATQPDKGLQRQHRASLEVGVGGFYGGYSGILEFFTLTTGMIEYIEGTILGSNGISKATIFVRVGKQSYKYFQGELVSPFALDAESDYEVAGETHTTNTQYLFRRGAEITLSAWGTQASAAWGWPSDSIIGKATQP